MSATKGELWRISILYLMQRETERQQSSGYSPSDLEDRDWKQNEAHIIQEEMVSDLLHHLKHP